MRKCWVRGILLCSFIRTRNKHFFDDAFFNGHYIWFAVGWEYEERYFYATYIHISIKPNGRVWLHHDGTSLALAIRMQERGIPAADIVLGFKAPIVRPEMEGGFAIGYFIKNATIYNLATVGCERAVEQTL